MIKKLATLLLIVLFSKMGFTQVRSANEEEIKKFLRSKTLVVLDENEFSSFNAAMKIAMEKTWKITPYQFVSKEVFEKKRKSDRYSFIMLSEVALNEGMMIDNYNILNFALGCDKESLNQMPDLGSIPLSYKGADEGNYLYKLEGFLNFMQYFVKQSKNGSMEMQNLYGLCLPDLKNKEIWITKDELISTLNTEEKINEIYPYSIKIKTKKEIQEAIENKNPKVAFTHTIAPSNPEENFFSNCWKFIISAKEGKVLYSEGHMIEKSMPGTFLKEDFSRIKACQ